MQEDRDRSQRQGPAAGLLCGILFVVSALLVLCSSYHSLDGNQQRIGRSLQQIAGPNRSSPPPEKPVAFLSGPKDDSKSPGCGRAMVQWNEKLTLRGGFKVKQDSLVVPITGRYWVYFQLNYSSKEGGANKSCKPLLLFQEVVWVREKYPDNKTLLQAQDTVTDHQHTFSKTLQASAAFDLAAGDRLFVVTRTPRLLSTVGYLGVDLETWSWRADDLELES